MATSPRLDVPLLTPAAAAALLALSVKSICRLASRGELPSYLVSSGARKCTLRFEKAALEAWLAARRVLPPGIRRLGLDATRRSARRA